MSVPASLLRTESACRIS
uniref:Uncharacterized protein n=1 Tax=Arundo donax TaxID=35708 RepID=A0A0A9CKG1_ARUDO